MRSVKMRQSHMTCSRLHSGKTTVAEALDPVVVRQAQAAHAVARVRVTLAAVAAMQADKASRAAAIVLPDPTIRRAALSRIR
jgi:hypothetical protein